MPWGIAFPSSLSLKSCTRTSSGSPFGRHSLPAFLKSPTSSFFLVSTLITGWPSLDRALGDRVDVAELRVTVGVLPALPRLDVRLQAVPQPAQKLRDRREVRLVAQLAQPVGEMPDALGRPAQKRLRIPAAISFDQPLEIHNQRRIRLGQPLAPTTRPPHPPRREPLPRLKLIDPLPDRRHRDPGRARRRRDPTPTSRTRLTRRPQPPLPLVQLTRQRPELLPDRNLIRHTPIVPRPNTQPCNIIYLRALRTPTSPLITRSCVAAAANPRPSGPPATTS